MSPSFSNYSYCLLGTLPGVSSNRPSAVTIWYYLVDFNLSHKITGTWLWRLLDSTSFPYRSSALISSTNGHSTKPPECLGSKNGFFHKATSMSDFFLYIKAKKCMKTSILTFLLKVTSTLLRVDRTVLQILPNSTHIHFAFPTQIIHYHQMWNFSSGDIWRLPNKTFILFLFFLFQIRFRRHVTISAAHQPPY